MEDNFILPFQFEGSHIRGRIVRFGSVLDEILSAHNYPEDVLHLTGEMTVITALLSSMLKYDGIFTLQTQSEGAVSMLVSDMTSAGEIRACGAFKEEALKQAVWQENRAELTGKGYMAFTVDQGAHTDRYQGIVELKPESLLASVQNYFTQSEQISTGMMMAVGRGDGDGRWRGGGIMLQKMPEDAAHYNSDVKDTDEDDWRRAMILLSSVKDAELLDPALPAPDLLYRLFHEEGVRIYDAQPLVRTCRCSDERVAGVLASMSEEDLHDMVVDGKITMTCEFCSREYIFDPESIKRGGQAS